MHVYRAQTAKNHWPTLYNISQLSQQFFSGESSKQTDKRTSALALTTPVVDPICDTDRDSQKQPDRQTKEQTNKRTDRYPPVLLRRWCSGCWVKFQRIWRCRNGPPRAEQLGSPVYTLHNTYTPMMHHAHLVSQKTQQLTVVHIFVKCLLILKKTHLTSNCVASYETELKTNVLCETLSALSHCRTRETLPGSKRQTVTVAK